MWLAGEEEAVLQELALDGSLNHSVAVQQAFVERQERRTRPQRSAKSPPATPNACTPFRPCLDARGEWYFVTPSGEKRYQSG